MRFFTSDLHFHHKNVIEFCNRPWQTVENMNTGLIERWNDTVKPDDEIFILGDFFFCGTQKAAEILKQLNGKKYWIMGNHDWKRIKPNRAKEFGVEWMQDKFSVKIADEDVKLCHFPFKGSGDHMYTMGLERFTEHRFVDDGGWLLCGHVHGIWKTKGRMINVGVDVWDYKPVAEAEIIKIIMDHEYGEDDDFPRSGAV